MFGTKRAKVSEQQMNVVTLYECKVVFVLKPYSLRSNEEQLHTFNLCTQGRSVVISTRELFGTNSLSERNVQHIILFCPLRIRNSFFWLVRKSLFFFFLHKSEVLTTVKVKTTMSWDIKPNIFRTKILSPFALLSHLLCDLVYSVVAISRWTAVCVQKNKDRVPNTKK